MTDTGMDWLGLVMEVATRGRNFDGWIQHARFHATSDDRGYPTGQFDWQRFHAALSEPRFRPCCGGPQYLVEHEVVEQFGSDFWEPFREAVVEIVARQRDREEVLA